jgi:hypothetical protein
MKKVDNPSHICLVTSVKDSEDKEYLDNLGLLVVDIVNKIKPVFIKLVKEKAKEGNVVSCLDLYSSVGVSLASNLIAQGLVYQYGKKVDFQDARKLMFDKISEILIDFISYIKER